MEYMAVFQAVSAVGFGLNIAAGAKAEEYSSALLVLYEYEHLFAASRHDGIVQYSTPCMCTFFS